MGSRFGAVFSLVVLVWSMSFLNGASAGNGLSPYFYARSCPNYEKIIYNYVYKLYNSPQNNTAISLVRWSFHDFFNGADASFLLLSKNFKGNVSEKDSVSQVGMRNSKYVNDIKIAVDAACPGVISCADVLAVAGAAAVKVLGGPYIPVKVGRRDSLISLKSSADKLPKAQASVSDLLTFFKGIGINTEEAVALMGGHTIGRAHCVSFNERIYPKFEPRLDKKFGQKLLYRCPKNPTAPRFTYVRNDAGPSALVFDNHYFVALLEHHGVMKVDDNLIYDYRTLPFVKKFARDSKAWQRVFTIAYIKLSEYKTLTGRQGEIRRRCSQLNSYKEPKP